ncbi:MAG: amidohydrolase family protein [Eubacterium sp.]
MIIDFHAHTFPDHMAERVLDQLSKTCNSKPHTNGTVSDLKKSMKENGIDYTVMMPIATKPTQVIKQNDIASAYTGADGLFSFGTMNPEFEDYKEELKRIKKLGIKGIKLHHDYMNFYMDDLRSIEIIREAFNQGLMVLVHAGMDPLSPDNQHCTPEMIAKVLPELGRGTLIAAHYGGLKNIDSVLKYLVGKDIVIDTSMGHAYNDMKLLQKVLNEHDSDKIIFGSDSPWEDQGKGLQILKEMVSNEMFNKITCDNPSRLLGL